MMADYTSNMNKIIGEIKRSFAEKSDVLIQTASGLKAVFCIGSSSNERSFPVNGYQDFDIHFYFDKIFLNKCELDSVKEIFKDVVKDFENLDTAIDYCIKDKPWKMIPRKKINIGLHGTVLNRLDFMKRIGPNYILAANMFGNSEVLSGHLDFPDRKITNAEFLTRAGGIGWLKENFYRLVNVLDPAKPEMEIPIREIAIYFGLTPLLHYYYLHNGVTANRKICRYFFENKESIPVSVKESVAFIYASKSDTGSKQENSKNLLEATHNILLYVGEYFDTVNGKKLKNEDLDNDEYSDIISALLGRNVSIKRKLCYFPKGDFSTISHAIKNKSSNYANVTPEEYVETIHFIVNNDFAKEINRLYFFEQNDLRSIDEIDFSSLNHSNFVYSWEKGIATYVQRLNEIYLNSDTLSERDVTLARILAGIGYADYCHLFGEVFSLEKFNSNVDFKGVLTHNEEYFRYLCFLAHLGNNLVFGRKGTITK